jgi:L-cystine transport system permease protein
MSFNLKKKTRSTDFRGLLSRAGGRPQPQKRRFALFQMPARPGTPARSVYLVYFAIPVLYDRLAIWAGWTFRSNQIPIFIIVVFAFGLNLASFLSETIRSGLEAVDKGEIEAGYSLGMTGALVFRRVIFPEAIRIFIPNFSSNLIACLHSSSLAYFVTLIEITGQACILAQFNWRYLETFLAAGILYWAITASIEVLTHLAETWLNRSDREHTQKLLEIQTALMETAE